MWSFIFATCKYEDRQMKWEITFLKIYSLEGLRGQVVQEACPFSFSIPQREKIKGTINAWQIFFFLFVIIEENAVIA